MGWGEKIRGRRGKSEKVDSRLWGWVRGRREMGGGGGRRREGAGREKEDDGIIKALGCRPHQRSRLKHCFLLRH